MVLVNEAGGGELGCVVVERKGLGEAALVVVEAVGRCLCGWAVEVSLEAQAAEVLISL